MSNQTVGSTNNKERMNPSTNHDVDFDSTQDAMNSLMACSLASTTIRKAYLKICEIADAPVIVTKKELMADIKRDFRVCKVENVIEFESLEPDPDDPNINNSGFALRSHYPGPYTRRYQNNAFQSLKKQLHPQLWTFELCQTIDLSGQLIGDKGVDDLCVHLSHSPVETIALNCNNITDEGMVTLSLQLRSLNRLRSLHLAGNKFRDAGVEALFHGDRYSPSLRLINLSENDLCSRSAWAIGMMFYTSRVSELESLLMGGQCHLRYSVDKFVRALVPHIILPGNRCLKKLSIGHAGLSDVGITAILALLMDKVNVSGHNTSTGMVQGIESLDLSRSPIFQSRHRFAFLQALVINRSLRSLVIKECGFRHHEMNEVERYIVERHTLTSTALVSKVKALSLFSDLGGSKYTRDYPLRGGRNLCDRSTDINTEEVRRKDVDRGRDSERERVIVCGGHQLCLPWPAYDQNYCLWEAMSWCDQIMLTRLVINEHTSLEQLRLSEESYVRNVRFAPVPVARQTLPSRSKMAMHGSGVTNVRKFSEKITPGGGGDAAKLAFLEAGDICTVKYALPDNLVSNIISILREQELKDLAAAKQKSEEHMLFAAETKDMNENQVIRLRKQQERDKIRSSYLIMDSLHLATSKNIEDLPEPVAEGILLALKNLECIDDQLLHMQLISEAATCELLRHIEVYMSCDDSSDGGANASHSQNNVYSVPEYVSGLVEAVMLSASESITQTSLAGYADCGGTGGNGCNDNGGSTDLLEQHAMDGMSPPDIAHDAQGKDEDEDGEEVDGRVAKELVCQREGDLSSTGSGEHDAEVVSMHPHEEMGVNSLNGSNPFEAMQYTPSTFDEAAGESEAGEHGAITSAKDLRRNPLYADIMLDTSRGLRGIEDDTVGPADMTLYRNLKHLHGDMKVLGGIVERRHKALIDTYEQWNQDLILKRERELARDENGTGGARMSRVERQARQEQLEKEIKAQKVLEEEKSEQFFLDKVEKTDRHQPLATNDFVSNARSLSGRLRQLDVPCCYASYCHLRTSMTERVRSGVSIAQLESSVTSSQKSRPKKGKIFNPRKGVRFRINTAPEQTKLLEEKEIFGGEEDAPREDIDTERVESGGIASWKSDGGDCDDGAEDVEEGGDGGDPHPDAYEVHDMYTPPGSQQNDRVGHDMIPWPVAEGEANVGFDVVPPIKKSTKNRKKKKVGIGEGGSDDEMAAVMTPEERKLAAREKKKLRSASREQKRDEERRVREKEMENRMLQEGFVHEEEVWGGDDNMILKQLKRKEGSLELQEPEGEGGGAGGAEVEVETLGQRRVRRRAEAKALKMSADELAASLLPPVKVASRQSDSRPTSKAQRRREKREAMAGIERRGQRKTQTGPNDYDPDVTSPTTDHDDESPPPLTAISKQSSFSASLKNIFGVDKHPAGPNPRNLTPSTVVRQQSSSLDLGAHRFDPLVVNEVYIPRKSALKIRLKLLDSAGVVSGFYITGFEPNCLAQTQDLVRERDKVEEVNGQILTVDMTLEEVNDLMNSAADKFVRLGIKRKAKKPLLRQYSGSDLPAQTIVTQRMIDDKTEEVEKAYAAKKKIRKEIKKWTKDFEKKENRVPSEEDKKGAPQLFKPLDQLFTYISEQEVVLDDMKVAFRRGDEKNPFVSHQYI